MSVLLASVDETFFCLKVLSDSIKDKYYAVFLDKKLGFELCFCEDYAWRHVRCKHITKAHEFLQRVQRS